MSALWLKCRRFDSENQISALWLKCPRFTPTSNTLSELFHAMPGCPPVIRYHGGEDLMLTMIRCCKGGLDDALAMPSRNHAATLRSVSAHYLARLLKHAS